MTERRSPEKTEKNSLCFARQFDIIIKNQERGQASGRRGSLYLLGDAIYDRKEA